MKPKNRLLSLSAGTLLITLAAALPQSALAADRIKQNNLTNLNLAASWDTLPGSTDVGVFSSTYATTGTLDTGALVAWQGLRLAGPGGNVLINNAAASQVALGTAGIDMSAATTNLVLKSFRMDASQTWNIASARTFRLGDTTATTTGGTDRAGTFTNNSAGATITIMGGGSVSLDVANTSLGNVNWKVNDGTLKAIWNQASSFGTGTITLGGGGLAVGTPIFGSVGNWTWNNAIALTASTSSFIDNQNISGSARWLKLEGVMSGSGALTFRNTGTGFDTLDLGFILGNTNTNTGTVTINSGAMVRVGAVAVGTITQNTGNNGKLAGDAATVVNNGTLTFSRLDSHTVANAISGSGGLRIGTSATQGTATTTQVVTLSGANSYTGTTTIFNGTAKAGVASITDTSGAFGNKSVVTVTNAAGATLDLNGFNTILGSVTGGGSTGGVITNSTTTPATLATGGLNTNTTFAGVISGGANLALTKTGFGNLTLTGTNTYTGLTTVSGGKLIVTAANATSAVSVASNGTLSGTGSIAGTVTCDDGATLETTGTLTLGGLTTNGGLTINAGTLSTSTAAISTGAIVTAGIPGIVSLNFASSGGLSSGTYHLISHTGGPLSTADFNSFFLSSSPALTSRQSGVLTNNATSLDYVVAGDAPKWSGLDSNAWIEGSTGAAGNWKLITNGTATDYVSGDTVLFDDSATNKNVDISTADVFPVSVTVTNTAGTYVIGGAFGISGSTSVAKSGAGTLALAGPNSYSGGTTLADGTLAINNAAALGSGSLTVNSGSLDNTSGGAIAVTTASPLVLASDLTFTGTNDLDLGTGIVALPASRQITVNGSVLTLSGLISGTGFGLTKVGTGTLALTAANIYTGSTTVNAGTLVLGNGGIAGNVGTGAVVISSGSTIRFNRSNLIDNKTNSRMRNVSGAGTIVIDGGGTFFNYPGSGSGFAETGSWNAFTGNLIVRGGSEFQTIRNGATAMGTGSVTLGDATTSGTLSQIEGTWSWTTPIQITGPDNHITNRSDTTQTRALKLQGILSGSGNVTFTDAAASMTNAELGFVLTAANTLSGTITIGATVPVRVGGVPGNTDATAANLVAAASGSLGSATVTDNGILTFSRSDSHSVANTISGTGQVVIGLSNITGTTTQAVTFTGTKTYSGATTVKNGALFLNTTLASSTVTVAAAGTLGGTGTAGGPVSVSGTLAPGVGGVGALSTGALTLGTSSTAAFDINTTATTSDVVHVTGNVTLGGGALSLNDVAAATLTGATKLTLITYSGTLTGTFSGLAEGATVSVGSNSFVIHYNDSNAVTLSAGDAYSTWTASHGLTGADAARDADPDHDGVKNVLEFLFGTEPNPANAGAASLASLPTVTEDATMLHFVYHRTSASVSSVTPVVQYSSTLGSWTAASDGVNGVTIQTTTDGFGTGVDMVTVNMPLTLGSGGKLFARLFVAVP